METAAQNVVLTLMTVMLMAACESSTPDVPADADRSIEHMAVGTFNAIDLTAGTVNISHEPVPSADWPAMTMNFKLDDVTDASELQPGQRVDIHFTIQGGMNATITYIKPID